MSAASLRCEMACSREPEFPLAIALHRRLNTARRSLFDQLAEQINARRQQVTTGASDSVDQRDGLSPKAFEALQNVHAARRQLATATVVHERMGALLSPAMTAPAEQREDELQDDLMLIADASWRPLVLGRALAAWLMRTSATISASRLLPITAVASSVLGQRHLLQSWIVVSAACAHAHSQRLRPCSIIRRIMHSPD